VIEPADAFVATVAASGLALTGWLQRTERWCVTDSLRRPVWLAFLSVLTLHAWGWPRWLRRYDPFHFIGLTIRR
jgi:H+/Cl- antiporter ClcA